MTQEAAINQIDAYFDNGTYVKELSARVAIPSESQKDRSYAELHLYLGETIQPGLTNYD